MDIAEALRSLAAPSLAGLALALLGGLVVAFSPSAFPLIPVVAGYVAAQPRGAPGRAMGQAAGFVLGLATANGLLGALAGWGGRGAQGVLGPAWSLLAGGLLVFWGLRALRVVVFRLPVLRWTPGPTGSAARAFLAGMPFALALCPYCMPISAALLTAAAAMEDPLYGTGLLFLFGLTRGIPLFLVGALGTALERLGPLARYQPWLERGAGAVLLGMGGYFLVRFFQAG